MSRYFTRKHYLLISDFVRLHIVQSPVEAQEYILPLMQNLCTVFKAEYPEFDEQRFLKLCALID